MLCAWLMLGLSASAQHPARHTAPHAKTVNEARFRPAKAAKTRTSGLSTPDPLDLHMSAARTYQIAVDYKAAAAEYRQAIAIALQRLGNLSVSEGKYSAGIELLKDGSAMNPASKEIAEDLAVAYIYADKMDGAKAQLEPILKREPEDFRALNLLGRVYFLEGKYTDAASQLQEAFTVNEDVDVLYTLALAQLEAKKLSNASVLFDDLRASVPDTPAVHMLLARAYQATGYLDLADKEFNRALKLNAKLPQANFMLGVDDLLRATPEKYLEARERFMAEKTIDPRDYSSSYLLGVVQFGENELPQAEKSLLEASALQSRNPDPWYYLGQLYSQEQRLDSAVTALNKSIHLTTDPNRNDGQLARAHYMLGQALQKLGQHAEAAAEIAKSQELQRKYPPQNMQSMGAPGMLQQLSAQLVQFGQAQVRAMLVQPPSKLVSDKAQPAYVARLADVLGNSYNNLGVIDARDGRFADACGEFSQAAKWQPNIPALDRNWGVAAFRAQLYSQAVVPLQRLLDHSPEDTAVREMLGISFYMTDDYKHSADVFRPIADQLPDNTGLLYAAGTALVRSGDIADGQKVFERMLEHGNDIPEIHLMLGRAHAEQGDYPDAVTEFEQALKLNPRLAEAHFNIGMVDFHQGKLDAAVEQFRQELSLNPNSVPAQYQLAYVLLQQHDDDQAISLLHKVIDQQPKYADAHYELGKALLETGDVPGATQELETAVQIQPSDYAYYQLSIAYRRAGRVADAQHALDMYTKLKPKPPGQGGDRP